MEHEEYKSLDDKDTFNEKGCEYTRCTALVERYRTGKHGWQVLKILSLVGHRLIQRHGEL